MKSNSLKKLVSGILAIGLISTMSISMNVSAAPGGMGNQQGDLNRDGSINYIDVLEMKKVILGISQLDNRTQSMADMNSDGSVNSIDLSMLKSILFQGGTNPNPPTSETTVTTVTTVPPTTDSSDTVSTTSVSTEPPVVIQDAISFKFSNSGVTAYDADGNEVDSQMVNGNVVTITVPGEYSFEGECSEGQIVVNVDKTTYPKTVDGNVVTLSLQGLTLSNTSTSPIYVASIDDICEISAKNGTTNTISDGTSYTNVDGGVGAIYSCDDIKIKGKGELIVNGNCEDGIVSKNDIKLWNGTITVNAVDDGIRGKDAVKIGDPDDLTVEGAYDNLKVTVNTQNGDGIKSTNYEDEGKGNVNINGGTINITSYGDGIQAEQAVNIAGGDLTITTTAPITSSSSGSQGGWGGMQEGNTSSTEASSKGIKASLDTTSTLTITEAINITGGTINIDSADDSIHSNGDITITGGTFTLASSDDGIHADGILNAGTTGGALDEFTVFISECYEGLEASTINQNSGTVIVNSTDDGYNAAGGADGSGNTSQGGWGQGSMSSSNCAMNLNGGFVLVNATDGDHDGFDSNGDLNINGGYVISNGNEPFDCGDGASLNFTGGVYVKNTGSSGGMGGMGGMGGSSSMTETVSVSGSVGVGERITITDESGNVIVSFLAEKSVSSVIAGCTGYSSAVVYSGGTITGTALSGTGDQECYVDGTITGGTQLTGSSSSSGTITWSRSRNR
ncbi:MAG: carbohydrate-binding domain-containing protein [Oscillospiraceae bacterium]